MKESGNRGWWLPGGGVDPGETFSEAACRETKEEAGIDIILKGILRVEHRVSDKKNARLKIIYYAEPVDPLQPPKSKPDYESELAEWVSVKELVELSKKSPGLRGPELVNWATYIENGGLIFPLNVFGFEGDPIPPIMKPWKDSNEVINGAKWTSLHLAVKAENLAAIEKLLKSGADVTAKTTKGRNVLHFAAKGKTEILKRILEYVETNAKKLQIINAKDVKGNTPLHIAATAKNSEAHELLIKAGAVTEA